MLITTEIKKEMASMSVIGYDGKESYKGLVLQTYEKNGYEDSDFFAIVWDEEKQGLYHVEYDTTRCGGNGTAEVDATADVIRKARKYVAKIQFKKISNELAQEALTPDKGKMVRIERGRKYKGREGVIFWVGVNKFSSRYNPKYNIGVRTNEGETFFCPIEYAKVLDAGDWMRYSYMDILKMAIKESYWSYRII